MATQIWFNICSGNDLMPDNTMPFPCSEVDLPSKVFCGIHLRAISQEGIIKFICNLWSEITLLRFLFHRSKWGTKQYYRFSQCYWMYFNSVLCKGQGFHWTLQWHHDECNSISNHWRLNGLLNCFFRCRSKKALKLHVSGLCEGNSLVTSEFPLQMASNIENVSICWCHHEILWGVFWLISWPHDDFIKWRHFPRY